MNEVASIYWYLFWAAVLMWIIIFVLGMAALAHRRNMKALEVLKIYAEKGLDPPAIVVEELSRQILQSPHRALPAKFQTRSGLLQAFVGFLFSACVIAGLHLWLADTGGPKWAVFASQVAMAFFAFGAVGLLLASLVSRDK